MVLVVNVLHVVHGYKTDTIVLRSAAPIDRLVFLQDREPILMKATDNGHMAAIGTSRPFGLMPGKVAFGPKRTKVGSDVVWLGSE